MTSTEDLERRVTELENEVARLRRELDRANAEGQETRVLASGADRDIAELRDEMRAVKRVLNALRENQIELAARMDRLEQRMDALEAEMRRGFAMLNVGMTRILELLEERD